MFGENADNVILFVFVAEKGFQFIDTNGWDSNDLTFSFIVFSDTHFGESLIKLSELIDDKIMSENESLVVVPDLGHLFDKEVRIIAFDNVFDFGSDVLVDELSDVLSNFLIKDCAKAALFFLALNFSMSSSACLISLSCCFLACSSLSISSARNSLYFE